MANFKVVHTWGNGYDYSKNQDYAVFAFFYDKGYPLSNEFSLDIIPSHNITDGGLPVNLDNKKYKDLAEKYINLRAINLDNISDIYAMDVSIEYIENIEEYRKAQGAYQEEYPFCNQFPMQDKVDKIKEQFIVKATIPMYRVTLSHDENDDSLVLLSKDVRSILGDKVFEELSKKPLDSI